MRTAAHRLLGPDADVPTPEELDVLTRTLSGMAALLISEVENIAADLPCDDAPAARARAEIGTARARRDVEPLPGLLSRVGHAQRLSRSVETLCDHYETLTGAAVTTAWRQVCRFCDHDITDPDDAVMVATKMSVSGPPFTVWAHRAHARFARLRPDEMAMPTEGTE
ncbi:DUF6415 family natural product biosynthesis protein [Streptomyces endophyticus]|uniref:DUF6415 family natural product biosynthesis protein n=1 Tax=Streptomyces endophyticus TaxID=714166 RepID=A0ABU6FEQ7_9ACTN|nr:DUF6415 family natural product biosynthesis protein [Streptomyces endophyticus]MEB8341790.1 DUF6415 family natural product biosynthesis protein [Streptomyces endophyticus]